MLKKDLVPENHGGNAQQRRTARRYFRRNGLPVPAWCLLLAQRPISATPVSKKPVSTKPAGRRRKSTSFKPDPNRALAAENLAPNSITPLLNQALAVVGPEAVEQILDGAYDSPFETSPPEKKLPWHKRLARRLGFGKNKK
ncbi:MAG: hypothetical protein WCT16_03750 [Candidatus Buchananbacteria bacterium]